MEIHTENTRKSKEVRYDDYIKLRSEEAARSGSREPYHLTYIREHGQIQCRSREEDKGE